MADFVQDLFSSVLVRVLSAVVLLVGVLFVWVAPAAQERFFPVIEPGSSRLISHTLNDDGWTEIQVVFTKNYNCRSIAPETEWFYTLSDGSIGPIAWGAALNSHSPEGVVVSPALRLHIPPQAVSVLARVLYNCGLPWMVYATIGPFDYPFV